MAESLSMSRQSSEALLYLTDEQLRQGIEAMFFAYRGFTDDPDRILRRVELWSCASPCDPFYQLRTGHDGQ